MSALLILFHGTRGQAACLRHSGGPGMKTPSLLHRGRLHWWTCARGERIMPAMTLEISFHIWLAPEWDQPPRHHRMWAWVEPLSFTFVGNLIRKESLIPLVRLLTSHLLNSGLEMMSHKFQRQSKQQWWSVTKYNYFVTVLKYIFQVSVLYWSSFILSNFYFYFTTFQSIRSYFLLHYIS